LQPWVLEEVDPRAREQVIEQREVPRVSIPNQIPDVRTSVLQIHHQVPRSLSHPRSSVMLGGTQNPDTAAAVLDHCQNILALSVERDLLEIASACERKNAIDQHFPATCGINSPCRWSRPFARRSRRW
jgi:hypothetical protein